jgi:pyruvate dehydrogenase E2 component (dihydrolipoamide acetyltransferase)
LTGAPQSPAPPTIEDLLAAYGEVEPAALTRVQVFTAKAMTQSWTTIPQVTHQDRMDVTELEARRRATNRQRAGEQRLTPLPYLLKAVAGVLVKMPRFNAAFDESGPRLVLRKYVNLGIAIDTPAGLVVGVIRGCDQMSVEELAAQANALSEKARAKGLSLSDMSGGGFTVSSLGARGGDGFTPLINAREAGILGVSRLTETPRRDADGGLEWRQLLPVSLTYDHRIVNGVDAGGFMQALQAEIDHLAGGHD